MTSNLEKAKKALETKSNTPPPIYQPFISSSIISKSFGSWEDTTEIKQMKKNIQQEIITERKKLGWTQRRLAVEMRYSQGTIARLETNMWVSMTCILTAINALNKKIILTNK